MRIKLLLLALVLYAISSQSQDCNYDYSYSPNVKLSNGYVIQKSKQIEWLDDINQRKICLDVAVNRNERYWLNNSIANWIYFVDNIDSIVQYVVSAFNIDAISFCDDYMSVYEASLIKDYNFDSYYLHMDTNPELSKIKSYCQENYESQFNQEYIDALDRISFRDQHGRVGQPVNWEIQNKFDKMNRITLDSLYNIYGFPSVSKVTNQKIQNAFMVMHHSTDCDWNEKWIERWLEHNDKVNSDLVCQYLDFTKWEKFNKN
jgi:hypothetical protein